MIRVYQKVTPLKVLRHFFDHPDEEFYLRELARLLGTSPMTVKRSLDLLVSDLLILRKERKNQILYKANVSSQAFRFAKVSYNLSMLESAKVVETLLDNMPGIISIILYGSFAKGENDRHSDLDLLVISMAKKVRPMKIGERLGMDVNVMNFTDAQWTAQAKENRAFYLDVITEGIVLHGTRPVIE
ncbi:MAG: nucleotidyltransferase domain-containing protein [Candidatus Thermoplasmatota archaeon]